MRLTGMRHLWIAKLHRGRWLTTLLTTLTRRTTPTTHVFVAESARDAIGDAEGFDWAVAGSRRLKDVSGEVKLFRVSRSRA
jgi:adenylate cyclase